MIRRQRKTHQRIWMVLAVLIVLFGFLSVSQQPEQLVEYNTLPVCGNTAQGAEKKAENELMFIQLVGGNQLEICLKAPLKAATVSVYAIGGEDVWLGTLSEQKTYRFPVPYTFEGIKLYDYLKKEELTILKF